MNEEEKGNLRGAEVASSGNGSHPATGNNNYTPFSASEAQKALNVLVEALPEEVRGRFIKAITTKVIRESLQAGGVELPPEIEAQIFNLKTISSAQILTTDYPPLPELVPGYLMAGLCFLIGKPKVGKSWLAMQLALSVLTGGKIFGKDVMRGRVLYFALEDSERRLQGRMKKQNWPGSQGVDFVLFDEFQNRIGALNSSESGNLLLKFIQRLDYKLVIVDTFSRAIRGDQLDVTEMTEALGPIQQYALSVGITVLLIDHMPKNANPNEYDAISHIFGSVAKAGVADTSWALYKERGRYGGGVLGITGREIEEQTLKLIFDKSGYYWHCEGNADEFRLTEKRKEIIEVLTELGTATASEIARAMKADLSYMSRRLRELQEQGLIERDDGNRTYKVV